MRSADRGVATGSRSVQAPGLGGLAPLMGSGQADVARDRERKRRGRVRRLAALVALAAVWVLWRVVSGAPVVPSPPTVDPLTLMAGVFFLMLMGVLVAQMVMTGRSPHVVYRPEQLDVRLADVVGIDPVKDEVVRSLQLFLAHKEFASEMGGRPRRGLLFEGPPGTGKTHTAKALAAEAGVPFLFATGTSFASPMQGASQRKVRQYFKALRKAALAHGGAVGFIDELDAIGAARSGVAAATSASPSSALCCGGLEGLPGERGTTAYQSEVHGFTGSGDAHTIVNELLVQMQSFDEPTGTQKLLGRLVDALNALLPASRRVRLRPAERPNVLLVASTNRADALDPALVRRGRFDQRLTFDVPAKKGRRDLVDHFLRTKAHTEELATDERRDALAAVTNGYSPAVLEGLLDEALVQAVQDGRRAMTWVDVERARMLVEVGVAQPVDYTEAEARLIATHEAGHAVTAWLVAPQRRLEILTIVKRRSALGLLAHGDREDVYTRSKAELTGLVQIALGGQVAEELFVGDVSTGPASDLAYATGVAAQMVGSAGMTGSLVSYAAVQPGALGDGGLVGRVLGDSAGRDAVEQLLQDQKAVVRTLLGANRHLVAALRDALLEHHELVGSAITDVLEAAAREVVVDLREQPAPVVLES
ncbi:ATP-dependent Zn protease [Motilibacter peucedani]|uniref:ATP-dependent Zn protease n=1 Tax=Motilibacter peucedani TaxID=598650 RepID=A0A420XMA6_9ACTN|nr:AAA family ATPase [Motilibacter peucedani]RKS72420.1 ATP-dependent Zn protease [Motilibacter peucedani]